MIDPDVLNDLQRRLRNLEDTAVRYRAGEITDSSPLSVALGGSNVPYQDVRVLGASSAQLGDIVAVLMFGNDLLVLGRVAESGPLRGDVSSAGAVTAGSGFSAVKDSTGRYTVTFDTAFPETPTILLGWGDTGGGGGAQVTAKSASAFTVVTYNTSGTVLDNSFSFSAEVPS